MMDRFNKFVKYQPLKSQMPHFDKIQQAFITCPNRHWWIKYISLWMLQHRCSRQNMSYKYIYRCCSRWAKHHSNKLKYSFLLLSIVFTPSSQSALGGRKLMRNSNSSNLLKFYTWHNLFSHGHRPWPLSGMLLQLRHWQNSMKPEITSELGTRKVSSTYGSAMFCKAGLRCTGCGATQPVVTACGSSWRLPHCRVHLCILLHIYFLDSYRVTVYMINISVFCRLIQGDTVSLFEYICIWS